MLGGTHPLENDYALDFAGSIRRARKDNRLKKLLDAVEAYLAFDSRLTTGDNISTLSDEDIADLWKSRQMTLDWHQSVGQPPPFDLFPEMETEASYAAWIEELAKPQVNDGSAEACRALAAAHLLIEALEGVKGPLAHCDAKAIQQLARKSSEAVEAVLRNRLFAETWSEPDYALLARNAKAMSCKLAASA